jgi:phage shock protein C
MSASKTRFYLDKRNSKLWGVCSGIADYFGWDPTIVRIGFVLGTVLGSGATIVAYCAIAWIAEPKPLGLYDESADDREFWRGLRVAPKRTLRDVNASFRDADRRLRDLELHVTNSNRELADEIEKLR